MSLPSEPVIKKFFTNKIESSRNNWYEYLIQIARTFYSIDGQEYRRELIVDKFSELSPRSADVGRDSSNFRDEFGAYGSFLGIFRLEKDNEKWYIHVSKSAKNFLCCENSNAAAFLRAQLSLFQYPNGMGAVVSESGSVSVQGNVKTDTVRELQNNIRLNPFRLICKIVVALVEEKKIPISNISLSYPLLLCLFNDDRLNQSYTPDTRDILQAYEDYSSPDFSLPNEYSDVLTNFKRNFHIVEKTGLFVRDSRFGLMISQTNYSIAYECIKTISEIDVHFDAFDFLYGHVDENTVRDIIAENSWGKYYDAVNLSTDILGALGAEPTVAPIQYGNEDMTNGEVNKYKRAAQYLKEYAVETGFSISVTREDIENSLETFRKAYAPEILESLDDEAILPAIFYTSGDNTNALCCWLEMNKECRSYFGSIAGGSAYKFGLFQRKETGEWVTGSPQKPQELSEVEALNLGKEIRDALVRGAKLIHEATLNSLEDYEKLDEKLRAEVGSQYYNLGWFHKYYSIIYPDKLCGFHSMDWQRHVLRALKIKPSEQYYVRSGQIAMIQNFTGWYYRQFFDVIAERFGVPRQFVRLGTSDDTKNYATEWAKHEVVGIGWSALGNLNEYVKGESIDRKEIKNKLKELYYPNDERIASRKAGEIARFYQSERNTIFVLMDGEHLIAFAENIGDYFFINNSAMAHRKAATWRFVFAGEEKLPEKSEGKMTSCYQLSNEDNILYLYDKYYYGEELGNSLEKSQVEVLDEAVMAKKIIFNTGCKSPFERNRILFGAPGTGKSYTVNKEAKLLLGENNEEDYERVTFHPDYSYANFVGTYKPVPSKDKQGNETITYAYVPGPFMRMYVKALQNGRSENIKPFLLIIEEINRANVAAVFGDIFQLLDRGDDGVSEYPIQASEDIKIYLAQELGGKPDDYKKIKIPDNMFIWATMNSADQGVFPMDTAFKRRWDFTYLGIDDSDEEIRGKYVYLADTKSQKVEWNKLRKAINSFLAKEKINEDKQLGPYFISKNIVVPSEGNEIDREKFIRVFKNKVIMYLFEDAARQKRAKLFEGCSQNSIRYSEICRKFDAIGIRIFNRDIRGEVEPKEPQRTPPDGDN